MAVEKCTRCDRWVDLDTNVEEMAYFNYKPVCIDCLDIGELLERIEELEVENHKLKREVKNHGSS